MKLKVPMSEAQQGQKDQMLGCAAQKCSLQGQREGEQVACAQNPIF